MGEHEGHEAEAQAEGDEQQEERGREHDLRHDHGQGDEGVESVLPAKAVAVEGEGDGGADGGGEHRGREADDEAVAEAREHLRVPEQLRVPVEREALPGRGEPPLVEREDGEHEERRVQEDVDEEGEGPGGARALHPSCADRSGRRNTHEQREHEEREQERHRGPERDVARHRELALDEAARVHRARPSQEVGGEERAQGRDEHEHAARDDAGGGEGQRHPPEGAGRSGAEVGGGLEERAVELLHGHVQREDHERQLAVDLAEHDREIVVEERQRRDPQTAQRLVHEPLGAQEEDPGVHPHEEARPEGQDHEDEERVLPPRGGEPGRSSRPPATPRRGRGAS